MDGVDPETLLEWLQAGVADERDLQMMALEQLCMLLLMSDNIDRCFESCPPRTFLPALCKIFNDELAPDNVLEVTARAITYYLDVSTECTRRIVQVDGAVRSICHRLSIAQMNDRTSRDLAEQCVKVLELMSARETTAIHEAGGLQCMLTFVQTFAPSVHKDTTHSAMTVVTRLCAKLEPTSAQLPQCVQALSSLLDMSDAKVWSSALKCFATLADRFARRNVDASVLNEGGKLSERLIGMLASEIADGDDKRVHPPATISTVLAILQSLCRSSHSVADAILDNHAQTLKGLTAALQHTDEKVQSDALRLVDLLVLLLTEGRGAINKVGAMVTHASSAAMLAAATAGGSETEQVHRAIIDAIRQKDSTNVIDLIESNDVDVNHMDDVGQTLLNWASAFGTVDMIKHLCENGADVNRGSRSSSLHYAACFGNAQIARVLLAHGADVEAKDESGSTALAKAKEREADPSHAELIALLTNVPSKEELLASLAEPTAPSSAVTESPAASAPESGVIQLAVDASAEATEESAVTPTGQQIPIGSKTATIVVAKPKEAPFVMNAARVNEYLTELLPLLCTMFSTAAQSMSTGVRRSTLALIRKATQFVDPQVLIALCTPTDMESSNPDVAQQHVDELLLTVVVHVFDEQAADNESVLTALQILANLLDAPHAHDVWLEHIVRFGVLGRIAKLVESARERDSVAPDAHDAAVDTPVTSTEPSKSIDGRTLYAWNDWRLMLTDDSLIIWCDAVAIELSLASNGWLWYVMDGRLLRLCSNGSVETSGSSYASSYASRLGGAPGGGSGVPAYTKTSLTEKLTACKRQCSDVTKRLTLTPDEDAVKTAINVGNWQICCLKEGELRITNTCFAMNAQCVTINEDMPGFAFDACTKQSSTHTAEATLNLGTFATGWSNKRGRRARFSREAVRHKVDTLAAQLWTSHMEHAHARPRKQFTRLQNAAQTLSSLGDRPVMTPADRASMETALKELYALMHDERTVSTYELGSSALIAALGRFLPVLVAPANSEALSIFTAVFGGKRAMRHLVNKLIGTLESVEHLPTFAYDSAGGCSQFGLQLLSRRLKFKLALDEKENENGGKNDEMSSAPRLLDRSGRNMRMEPLCTVGQIRGHLLRVAAKQWYHYPRATHAYVNTLRDRLPHTLAYTHDFDQNGLMFFVGSNGGAVDDWTNPCTIGCVHVTNSDPQRQPYGRPADILSRETQPINCHSRDDVNAWFTIDLGVALTPSAYTLRHARGYGRSALRTWQLLGSNDCQFWSPLRHHANDESLMEPGSTHTWTIDDIAASYRYVRIQQMGTNASQQTHYLSISGFEIYGTVTAVFVDEVGGEPGHEMKPRVVVVKETKEIAGNAETRAKEEEAAVRAMVKAQRRSHGMRLRSSLGGSSDATTESTLRIGDTVVVAKGTRSIKAGRHSLGSGRAAKQGKIVATLKSGRHEVEWANGTRTSHGHAELEIVADGSKAAMGSKRSTGKRTTPSKAKKTMPAKASTPEVKVEETPPTPLAVSQQTIDKATSVAAARPHDKKSMSTTNLFDSSDACKQAVSVSATGAAASAESLQHQTASLENLLARSRVYDQQRDTSIASTLSTLTSGESLQSGGAGSAHTLDSVPEEKWSASATAMADDATPPLAPRALTIARAPKKTSRKSTSREKKRSTPNLTIHDVINNARNAAVSKLEPPTKEGEAPARRDVIVFNKAAPGMSIVSSTSMITGTAGKGAGVCLSGESASTFLDWYDDIMRAQTSGDSNTTNADDRSAAVRDKISKLLSATEGTPLSQVLMRALGGAAGGSSATDGGMPVDEADELEEESMDLYDALKQTMPATTTTAKDKAAAGALFDIADDAAAEMAMIDEDDDDDTDRTFDAHDDYDEDEEEMDENDSEEVETSKEEPSAAWRSAAAPSAFAPPTGYGTVVTQATAPRHPPPFMRAYDDDYVLKRQFSALIPAFDPRPGRTNVNQTQDVTVPPPVDGSFSACIHILPDEAASTPGPSSSSTSETYRQPRVALHLHLTGAPLTKIELVDDDCTMFSYVQRLLQTAAREADDTARVRFTPIEKRIWDSQFTLVYRALADTEETSANDATRERSRSRGTSILDDRHRDEADVSSLRQVLDVLAALHATKTERVVDSFVSQKITHKLAQQLKDPLVIAADALPEWCSMLMCRYAWLFPLATRKHYLSATAYGTSRSIVWLQAERDRQLALANQRGRRADVGEHYAEYRVGRIKHERVRVPRDDEALLKHAQRLLHFHARRKAVLEIEYEGEEGTGLGPTLEFYALLAAELQRKALGMWLCDDADEMETRMEADDVDLGEGHKPRGFYVRRPGGLFPAPFPQSADVEQLKSAEKMFRMLGTLLGKALQDGRLVDLPLSLPMLKIICSKEFANMSSSSLDLSTVLDLDDLKTIHPVKAEFLLHLEELAARRDAGENEDLLTLAINGHTCHVSDLALTFELNPSSKCYEWKTHSLVPGGHRVDVTIDNLHDYVRACKMFYTDYGIRRQMSALRAGLSEVMPLAKLRAVWPDELKTLMCGEQTPSWTFDELVEHTEPKLGFTRDSPTFINLCEVLVEMSGDERKAFLQFTTGCSSLPPGGLANLHPRLTIVRKVDTGDGSYPSVNTCVHYLKLPDYTSKEVLRRRLVDATLEKGFHLA